MHSFNAFDSPSLAKDTGSHGGPSRGGEPACERPHQSERGDPLFEPGSAMIRVDARGCDVTGATPAALESYERALAAYQSWCAGVDAHLRAALQKAPAFVMAHVLRAWLLVSNRDPRRVRMARPILARAGALPANAAERLHLAAIAATLADDYEGAKAILGEALRLQPRDLLALQVAHAFDYLTGDLARLGARVKAVLPAWSARWPGYHAVLAMYAFGLEECGDYEAAETAARAALVLNPNDARAHHVMAHVFEMTERPRAGVRWMYQHLAGWGTGTVVAMHCWWHIALFRVAQGRFGGALAVYDQQIRRSHSSDLGDLIDASALLWRVEMRGGNAGNRWAELTAAWATHIDDGFCTFTDVHAMLAFVGAREWELARRLERALVRAQALPTRYGETTRQVGLAACRALIAFGRGNDTLALTLLKSLPALARQIGGSHAQRDVLYLTLRHAAERIRLRGGWRGIGQSPVYARFADVRGYVAAIVPTNAIAHPTATS